MALVNRSFSVNVTPGMMPTFVHVSEYDVGRAYTVSILDEQGNTFTIPNGTTASIEGTLNGSVGFTQSASISNNQVSFTLSESMTAYSGKAWCKIKLTQNSQPIQTCAFVLAVDRAGVEAETVIDAPGFEEQIQDAVDNYLDAHPVGVEVDPTLTVSGAAADSEVTGERFSEVQSGLINGRAPIFKQVNWINAYVDSNGLVKQSSQSKTAVVPMAAGERVEIGTRNTNITIIGTTTNSSIAVGDTVTPYLKTGYRDEFLTFAYNALTDVNVVISVNASDYSLSFYADAYAKTEIDSLREKVLSPAETLLSKNSYVVTQGGGYAEDQTKVQVDFPVGTKYKYKIDDPDGCISKYYFYTNGSSDYANRLPNTEYIKTAESNVSTVSFYIYNSDAISSGTISFSVFKVTENPNSVEAKADSAILKADSAFLKASGHDDYVPTGITDGYVIGRVTANGSFTGAGVLTTGAPNRIRTSMIPVCAGDKIIIENGGFQHGCGMWDGEPSIETNRRNDNTWSTVDETIVAEYDGYLVIVFSLSSNANITPSDFDGAIKLYNTFAYRAFMSATTDTSEVPDYYLADDYLKNKADRINALGEFADDVFVFITDIHWELNAKHSPALINYLSSKCQIERMFDGGDVADRITPSAIRAYRDNFDGKIYRLCGNHDWFAPATGKALYYWLNSRNDDQIGKPFEHYWYVDNIQQKIRYITLNSFKHQGDDPSSGWQYGFDSEQIAWFRNDALNVPSGYDVLVFTHFLRSSQSGNSGYASIESAIADFNADTSNHGEVLAVFQGHAHWDAIYHTVSGVPVITTTCDKWDLSNESSTIPPEGIAFRELGTKSEQAFDVMVLNRNAKTITAVRIGALAQDNIDKYRTDTGFTWIGTLEERVISYANE